jgi:deoxyadenosine/deoxycytidine kinase
MQPKSTFSDAEIEAVRAIFHDYAAKMLMAVTGGSITQNQYEAYEVLYDKLMYFMENKVYQ